MSKIEYSFVVLVHHIPTGVKSHKRSSAQSMGKAMDILAKTLGPDYRVVSARVPKL